MSEPVRIEDQITPRTDAPSAHDPSVPPPAIDFPREQQIIDPFEGKTTRINHIQRPLMLGQLAAEIAEAAGLKAEEVHLSLAAADPYQVCSNTNQGVMYVRPAVDEKIVRGVISKHEMDPDWGVHPSVVALRDVRSKLDKGTDLTKEDLQTAIRALVMRDSQQVPS